MNQSNLELRIDQLILPDLPPRQRERVTAAIERELTKLWHQRGKPAGTTGESLALAATQVEVAAGATPEVIGAQVAQSIYGQLQGSGQPQQRFGETR